jgi:phenylacetic acid degradation protein
MKSYEFEGKRPSVDTEAFVHPDAVLIGDVTIEAGCYVGAGAVLRGDLGSVRVGKGSNVQENCVIHTFPNQTTILNPDSHIGHGTILHGCEVCSNVMVGMGSILADGVKICSNCIVGAGSFVSFGTEIPPDSVAVGSPAKVIKKITAAQLENVRNSRLVYQELARRYLKSFKAIEPDK